MVYVYFCFFVCLASRESTRIPSLGKVHMPLPLRFENEITKRFRLFLKRREFLLRKFKEVKRKEIIFDMTEWKQIEKAAAKVSMQTSEYIRRMSLDGKVVHLEMSNVTPVVNALRIIGNNINQIVKKRMKQIQFTQMIWKI